MLTALIAQFLTRLPRPVATAATHALSLLTGLLIALILHYLLYRISLPGTPFIYVVF